LVYSFQDKALAPAGGEISLQLISVKFILSLFACFLGGAIVTDAKRTATLAIRAFRAPFCCIFAWQDSALDC